LAETTYRDVNIGLANQFAKFADKIGVDVYKVIEACNSQPFSHIHQPGIAVGGHCIPVYPRLYLWNDPDATVVRAARDANASMPSYAIKVLEEEVGSLDGKHVVVLGVAYRGGVKEAAFSGVFPLVELLQSRGASVGVIDPVFEAQEILYLGLPGPGGLEGRIDAAILQADHVEFRDLESVLVDVPPVVVDGRAVLPEDRWEGTRIICIGRSGKGARSKEQG
jgi:nucleotide sugar dehydrogenase